MSKITDIFSLLESKPITDILLTGFIIVENKRSHPGFVPQLVRIYIATLSLHEDYRFVLNYFRMNNYLRKLWVLPILVMMLMTACSPPEDTSSSNNNVAQSSNGNTAPPVAMRDSPLITANANVSPPLAKTLPSGKPATIQPSIQPVPVAPTDKAPKLVAPTSTIQFGKQPQDKTLVRTFQIRNTGNAELNIENVQPG